MDPAEVLAVEIKQYVGGNLRTLVPRVIGQTVEAQRRKSGGSQSSRRQWDEEPFFEELETKHGAIQAKVARKILEWARSRNIYIWWGKGKKEGSFVPTLEPTGKQHPLFAVWTSGRFEFYFRYYRNKPPFESEEKRLELLRKINDIPDISLPEDAIDRRPSVQLATFNSEVALNQLFDVFDEIVQEIKSSLEWQETE